MFWPSDAGTRHCDIAVACIGCSGRKSSPSLPGVAPSGHQVIGDIPEEL